MNTSKIVSDKSRPDSYHKTIKCVVVGDGSVGKTCMLVSYTSDKLPTEYVPTIFENYTANVKVDHQNINLSLWDTAGQERFKNVANTYYKGAHSVLLVYDITNPNSFKNLETWINEVDKYADCLLERLLIGNKCDLEDQRKVSQSQAKEFAKKIGVNFLETSAKDTINIDAAFQCLVKESIEAVNKKKASGGVMDRRSPEKSLEGNKIVLTKNDNETQKDSNENRKKKGCC